MEAEEAAGMANLILIRGTYSKLELVMKLY